jgi:hypothetical protein
VQIEKPHDLKNGATQEVEIQIEKPQDLRGGGHEEKKPQRTQEQRHVQIIPKIEEVSNI